MRCYLYLTHGDKRKLRFVQVEPYIVEMSGWATGAVMVKSCKEEEISALSTKDGPYIYAGMDVKCFGLKPNIVSHLDIEDNKILLHLRQ